MAITINDVSFSFLLAGPRFGLSLPGDFDGLATLSSPLANGKGGGRSFDFIPTSRDVGINDSVRQLSTVTDRDGRLVEVFERVGEPQQWYLRWPLFNGALYTHLRREDGVEMAAVTAQSLSVVEDAEGGTPSLLPNPPLHLGNMTWPGYQENARFYSSSRAGWSVMLRRPGFLADGQVVVSPNVEWMVLRAGTKYGVEVQVSTPLDTTEAREVLSMILASLVS